MISGYDELAQEDSKENWPLAIIPSKNTVSTRFPIRDYIQQTHLGASTIEYERYNSLRY